MIFRFGGTRRNRRAATFRGGRFCFDRAAQENQIPFLAVFATYPFETTGFIRTQRDRFANPVGHATRAAGELIYDAVTGRDVDLDKVHAAVAELIRIRAVQDLKPEQAVGVLYLYKPVLRELLLADMLAAGDVQGFLDMGDRLDTLCLMAFNLYLADREQVYAERVAQQRREASQIRRWAARHGMAENQGGE